MRAISTRDIGGPKSQGAAKGGEQEGREEQERSSAQKLKAICQVEKTATTKPNYENGVSSAPCGNIVRSCADCSYLVVVVVVSSAWAVGRPRGL